MILTTARTRIRTLVDDIEAERWSDAQIDAALGSAQYEALLWAVAAGANIFTVEASITTSTAGVGDLSSIKPLKIVQVALLSGTSRCRLSPVALHDVSQPVAAATTLKVSYTARPVFPASGAAEFVWGQSGVSCPPLDSLMCVLAASELKITEGEALQGLEARKSELLTAVRALICVPGFSVMPMGSRRPRVDMVWAMSGPDALLLAYP